MDDTAKIATIGSPSRTTAITLEILADAAKKKLIGELVWFEFEQNGESHRALGQITEVELNNMMLELPPMRSLARHRGSINPVSGMQDTHKGIMSIGATFVRRGSRHEQAVMGTVPPTGTYVGMADDGVINALLSQLRDKLFYLGRFYESETRMPMRFPHFGSPSTGGAGEAYHIGIYGKTGSGKSTLAKMLLAAYARHRSMSLLVLDPSGEFTQSARGEVGNETFRFDLKSACKNAGKVVRTYDLKDIVLDRWELFYELVVDSKFLKMFLPTSEKRDIAMEMIKDEFGGKGKINLGELHKRKAFDHMISVLSDEGNLTHIYKTQSSRNTLAESLSRDQDGTYRKYWKPLGLLFKGEGKIKISDIIGDICESGRDRPLVVINLARKNVPEGMMWNESIKAIIIRRVLWEITRQGEDRYKEGGFLNTLVVLDEAQRLVPHKEYDDEKKKKLRADLVDAVQTTRKYGLGWMFLSTSLSTLHRDIYHENRISFYGFGLTSGAEMDTLREVVADKESLDLYRSFRDPHSSMDKEGRSYSFMSRGPVSPLSFSGSPMFLTAYNNATEFLNQNRMAGEDSAEDAEAEPP